MLVVACGMHCPGSPRLCRLSCVFRTSLRLEENTILMFCCYSCFPLQVSTLSPTASIPASPPAHVPHRSHSPPLTFHPPWWRPLPTSTTVSYPCSEARPPATDFRTLMMTTTISTDITNVYREALRMWRVLRKPLDVLIDMFGSDITAPKVPCASTAKARGGF